MNTRKVNLEDEDVRVAGVLSQSVFPRDGELGPLRVCPEHAGILGAVDLGPQPRDEQRLRMRHFCRTGYRVNSVGRGVIWHLRTPFTQMDF